MVERRLSFFSVTMVEVFSADAARRVDSAADTSAHGLPTLQAAGELGGCINGFQRFSHPFIVGLCLLHTGSGVALCLLTQSLPSSVRR